jgi:hypothetical protein
MDLRDAQGRAREPFGEIRDVLTNQVARRRDQADIAFLFEDRVDRDAQHDLGLPGSRRRLEQKFEEVVVETAADRVDRDALIVGEPERFAGLDEFVRKGNRLGVAVDRRPDLGL